jgi:hypothetical protein
MGSGIFIDPLEGFEITIISDQAERRRRAMFIDPSTTKTKLRWSGTFALLRLPMSLLPELRLSCFSYKHFAPTALAEVFQS